ncbi:hypothetical protein CR970_04285 [Candidatus Saccharibacteria bacterium]|nr:MAG: hypothetical protein CR970_04285 [Candidatus Saccharibacteria bacterium]
MILKLAGTVVVAGVIFLVTEYIRRLLKRDNEVSRKTVHIVHGLLIASWPFVLSGNWVYTIIIATELLFVCSVVLARRLGWFGWMWQVGRVSWGELMYPAGVTAAVVLAANKWVFVAAILVLALGDAVAALLGIKYGKTNSYRVFGQKKSVVGTTALMAVAVALFAVVVWFGPPMQASSLTVAALGFAVIMAATENLGTYGMDNMLLPVVAVLFLNSLY